jgi:hypothetical protein
MNRSKLARGIGGRRWLLVALVLCAVVVAGCGREAMMAKEASDAVGGAGAGAPAAAPYADFMKAKSPEASAARSDETTRPDEAVPKSIPRKIIYTAEVDLIVNSFTSGEGELQRLVKAHGGYFAGANVTGTPGTPRQGSWTVRVPVARFDAFMGALTSLGELQRTHTDSQDVTEEYYDLGARMANKQVEERRLLQHLQRSTARLTDILAVEKELTRVRGEIEQIQGRLKLLSNQTELTTVTVSMREVKGYVAPKPATFGTQISRTFGDSLFMLGQALKTVVLMIVALIPWLLVPAVVLLPIWLVWRRYHPAKG